MIANKHTALAVLVLAFGFGCGDDDDVENPDGGNDQEVITTLNAAFTPMGGGEAITASFRDADGEGGDAPVVTSPAALTAGTTYTMTIDLLNETVPMDDPEYRIGEEIEEEAEEHQYFFEGSAISGGVISHMYADVESDYVTNSGDDLPVGIRNTFVAEMAGTGQLTVILKHLPPVNDMDVKVAGITSSTGESDIEVTFDITVE